jgi:PAS domain S-box-containing protein
MVGLARWLVALAVVASVVATAAEAAGADPRSVLLIYGEAGPVPAVASFDQGIKSVLQSRVPGPLRFYTESLDSSWGTDARYEEKLAELLVGKYAGRKLDLIVPCLDSAIEFTLKHRATLFPGVPVVFCGASPARTVSLPPDVTGVTMVFDWAATVDLALRIHPDTERVVYIGGASRAAQAYEAEARQAFSRFPGLQFDYLTGLPMAQILDQVRRLPKRTVIVHGIVLLDGAGASFTGPEGLSLVRGASAVPIYSARDSLLGHGIVGGPLVGFETQGVRAGQLALRVLRGERLGPADTLLETSAYMFDARELARFGIDEGRLPPGSTVQFRSVSVWQQYRWQIAVTVSVITLQTVLVVALLAQRAQRRRADLRFWQVLATAPYGVIMVGQDGRIAMANAHTEKLFGYPREEMLGQPVEILVPERFRTSHSTHRARFSASPEVRRMGAGRELCGRRKDGSEFPVEIALSPAQPGAGRLILATIVDISLRKQAEEHLRLSQIELRRLTGRLLQAQESESRRIARELHDDLGQRLALLTVEMDLVRQKPPEAAGEVGARLQELLVHVRQLSSSVHNLSHRLHPSNLEQLGLVTAIGSLCNEFSHGHGLKIDFAAHETPSAIPPYTAVCLYRIAQEGLRNAVKHSGAQHATVELSGTADAISLRIVDDGTGFDPRVVQGKGGLGLVSMRERVRQLGGEILIDSQLAAGTQLQVRLPLSESGQTPPA